MDLAFTRYMEEQLDKIEEQHLDWVRVLNEFYGRSKKRWIRRLPRCSTPRRKPRRAIMSVRAAANSWFTASAKTAKFLSCSAYPKCKFAWPCDKEGKMVEQQVSEHKCPVCGKPMIHRKGRFGAFLGCSDYPSCKAPYAWISRAISPAKTAAGTYGIRCHKCRGANSSSGKAEKGLLWAATGIRSAATIVSVKQKDS